MKLRIYGNIKDTKTSRSIIDANVKLFLDKNALQEVKSIKNGFFEIITEIDDSRIESGQQLRVTVEKEGYQMQEHRVFTTKGSFNLDVELEPVVTPPPIPKKSFNRLPLIIGGGVLLALLIGGIIAWLLLRPKTPEIINFSLDSNSIDIGESATLHWDTKNATTVKIEPGIGEVKPRGDIKVNPARTIRYTLIAMNEKEKIVSEALTVEGVDKKSASELLDASGTIQTKSGGLNIMGSVGIGTKTPSTELEVNGTVTAKAFSGSINWPNIANIPAVFADNEDNVNDADADPSNEIQKLSTNANKITLSKGNSIIAPYAHNADKLDGKDASEFVSGSGGTQFLARWKGSKSLGNSAIFDNGNVGIGTTNPGSNKLQVDGYTLLGGGIANSHFPYTNGWAYVSGKGIIFREDAAGKYEERMRIADNGNVGIGTAQPTAKLDVNGDISQPSGGWKKLGQDRYTFSQVWSSNISNPINIGSPFLHTRDRLWSGTITVAARTGGNAWDIQYFYYGNFWGHTIHGNGWNLSPIIRRDDDSYRSPSPIQMYRPNDRSNTMMIKIPIRKGRIKKLHIHVDMYTGSV